MYVFRNMSEMNEEGKKKKYLFIFERELERIMLVKERYKSRMNSTLSHGISDIIMGKKTFQI